MHISWAPSIVSAPLLTISSSLSRSIITSDVDVVSPDISMANVQYCFEYTTQQHRTRHSGFEEPIGLYYVLLQKHSSCQISIARGLRLTYSLIRATIRTYKIVEDNAERGEGLLCIGDGLGHASVITIMCLCVVVYCFVFVAESKSQILNFLCIQATFMSNFGVFLAALCALPIVCRRHRCSGNWNQRFECVILWISRWIY